ncbi:diguanylate cyclase [Agromyces allii]|nr:diguanylate cyclase [Agromyces allii]
MTDAAGRRAHGEIGPPAVESSFEDLYEHAPCGHLSTASDGTILRVNSTFLEWTGYSVDQLVGSSFADLLTPGGRIFAETRYLPVLRLEGSVKEVALPVRRADGTTLPTLVNSVVVEAADGGPGLIRSAIFDATSRQDYELDLLNARRRAETSEERVRVLQRASAAFLASASEAAFAEALAGSMQEAFAATAAAVYLADESGRLELVAGAHPIGVADDVEPDDGPGAEALRSGRVLVWSRSGIRDGMPTAAQAMKEARFETLTATPLPSAGTASGVVLSAFGRERTFDAEAIALHEAIARQASEALARIRLQSRLERMALYDQLTGLANRQLLKTRLGEVLAAARRESGPTALVVLDLDGFKAVNDRMGHMAGDAVLREIADRLRSTIRPGDVAGRFGGDEFMIICENTTAASAEAVADRLRGAINLPLTGVLDDFSISASIGVAVHDGAGSAPAAADLFAAADAAMFRSKHAGKDVTTVVVL